MATDEENITTCDNGIAMDVITGYGHAREGWAFGYVLGVINAIFIRFLPCVLLLIFDLGLIIAVLQGRLRVLNTDSEVTNSVLISPSPKSSSTTPDSTTVITTSNTHPTPITITGTSPTKYGLRSSMEKELVDTMIAIASCSLLLILPIHLQLFPLLLGPSTAVVFTIYNLL